MSVSIPVFGNAPPASAGVTAFHPPTASAAERSFADAVRIGRQAASGMAIVLVKWDARPGNAVLSADGAVGFDWEHCGARAHRLHEFFLEAGVRMDGASADPLSTFASPALATPDTPAVARAPL